MKVPKDRTGGLLTEQEVIARLRDRVAREGGTLKMAASRLGVSDALLSATMSEGTFRRKIGPHVLKILGLRRVERFEEYRPARRPYRA
jgi:hypothetical protein